MEPLYSIEAVAQRCSVKKVFLEISQKETLVHVFSCEFCEISKTTFSTEHLQATASNSNWQEIHWFVAHLFAIERIRPDLPQKYISRETSL